jgi:ER membrane protein complex subunit 1
LYHVNALTGKDETDNSPDGDILQGTVIFPGQPSEAYLLPTKTKGIMLLDSANNIHLYPRTDENVHAFAELTSSLRFSLQTSGRSMHGYQVAQDAKNAFSAYQTWTLSVPNNELIGSVIRPTRGPIASLGKVLGDRSTLYKYLNPNLFAITTASKHSPNAVCSVYLVDGSKGSIIYHASVTSTKGACRIEAELTENWLVYGYYDEDAAGSHQTKGHRIVSVEVYEGKGINEKTRR